MDVISLGKANQILKKIKELDQTIVAPLAEDRFKTVDERLDWLEAQASKMLVENTHAVDLTKGAASGTEVMNGKIQLKKTGEIGSGYTDNIIPSSKASDMGTIVQESSSYSASTSAWNVFDYANDGSYWATPNNVKTGWVSYSFSSSKKIVKYSIKPHSGAVTPAPKNWTFEGWDGSQWVILDTRSGVSNWTTAYNEYSFNNTNFYTKYRLNVTANNGDTLLWISKIKMMESAIVNSYTPSGTYETPIIDLGEGWQETKLVDVVKQIKSGGTSADVVPRLASNTSAPPVVITSNNNNVTAWKLFDDTISWDWLAANGWIQIDFGAQNKKRIIQFSWENIDDTSTYSASQGLKIQASNDSTNWIDLHTTGILIWGYHERKVFTFSNENTFRYYRILNLKNTTVAAREIELMEALPGTNCDLTISTSTDGTNFTPYTALDNNNLTQARYVKIRATLSAVGQNSAEKSLDFNQSSKENTFTLNEFTEAAGKLQLKNAFLKEMQETEEMGTGHVMSYTLDKNKYKKIEKVEVK